jgi:glyoxylase-like metal-dependent hydrolase (beta-lactamase superfamily II)
MKLFTINTGFFKLDGGAMFGVVPKSLWKNLYSSDENNLCTWALRCLLVDTGKRLILIDNGLGSKQSEKFFSHYEPHGVETLESSLLKHGYTPDDITDNFLTHLHFDHCGGGVKWNKDRSGYEMTFPNATYWTNKSQWDHAINPNQREKASF